jgi:hypothetical protein
LDQTVSELEARNTKHGQRSRCGNVGWGVNRRQERRNHWCDVRGFREMGQVVGQSVSVCVWKWTLGFTRAWTNGLRLRTSTWRHSYLSAKPYLGSRCGENLETLAARDQSPMRPRVGPMRPRVGHALFDDSFSNNCNSNPKHLTHVPSFNRTW